MTKITFETNLKVTLKNTSYLKKTKLFFLNLCFFFYCRQFLRLRNLDMFKVYFTYKHKIYYRFTT